MTPAPEPVEVTPDELTEAEGWFVYWQTVGTSAHDGEERRAAVLLEAEYRRMRTELAEAREHIRHLSQMLMENPTRRGTW